MRTSPTKGMIAMNTPNQANANPAAQFIATCELAECAPAAEDTIARGAVVASSLMAFAQGTSAQGRQDVMDSFLFATLAANKAHNPQTQADQWYEKFNEVLARLGWLWSQWRFARQAASGRRLSLDQMGLEVLAAGLAAAALPGPASAAMLKVATEAVKALGASQQPLGLFERQTRTHHGAHLRIASCIETTGLINVVMGAVSVQASTQVTDVLFGQWSDADGQAWRGEGSLVLNSRLYAENRDLVQQRLGAGSRQAIAEFDI